MLRTLRRILGTRYPAFLFGLPVRRGEIPIFNYHDVEGPELRSDLEFLACNGYRTLRLDEFLRRHGRAQGPQEVLLTFDDARESVERVALPLLQEFRAHAVLFVPTLWMSEPKPGSREASLFMTWDGVRKCRDSGVFAIESHSHRHALVHISPHLVTFADPIAEARYDVYDWPVREIFTRPAHGFPPLGTPIYAAAPLLSTDRCYLESASVSEACQHLVARSGGPDFFRRRDALARLRRVFARRMALYPGRFLQPAALQALVDSEFALSWLAFERHLGSRPACLAFPWMLGSRHALQCAQRFGLVAAFGCALDYRRARAPGLPIPVFGRLKADWLKLLPGKGRTSLPALLRRKCAAFSSLHNLAH